MPNPVRAVEIDSGSEFMAVPGLVRGIELACADSKIPLYVLPPRSPKLNGRVERCNGAWRYEFYPCSDLPLDIDKLAKRVDAFQHLYNNH
jgi:putative transposase